MFWRYYPNTDFHELNLDWLLREWRKFLDEYKATNDKVDDLEATIEEFREYINNYFDNLDVQEEINNKLDEMSEDGTLESLLQDVVDTAQVMNLNPTLSVSMYRGLVDNNDETGHPSFLQACAVNNGVAYMIFMLPALQGEGIGRIYATDTGTFISEVSLSGVDHANGADYYDGHIYLATLTGKIIKYDTSFTPIQTYNFDIGFRSVTFDNDGTCYGASGATLYRIDLDNETYSYVSTLDFVNDAYQSGIIRDGWLYEAGLNPSCMYRINASNGRTSKIYNIDRYIDLYCVGEVESVAHDRVLDKYYIVSCSYYNYANYRNGNLFEANFNTNLSPKRRYAGGSALSVGGLYVGANTNGLPDGTVDNPFPCLASALMAYNSPTCETFKTYTIYMQKDCPDEILFIRRNNIRIVGNGYIIGEVSAYNSTLKMTNVVIKKPNGYYTSDSTAYPIYCNSCDVDFNNITINDSNTVDYTYSMVLSESTGTVFNLTNNSVVPTNTYHTLVSTTPANRSKIYFEAQSMQNMYKTPTETENMTDEEIYNASVCAYVVVRVSKGGKNGVAIFQPATTSTSLVTLFVGGRLEFHDIRQTYSSSTGYTYSVSQSKALSGVSSAGSVTTIDTTEATINSVLFVSKWS